MAHRPSAAALALATLVGCAPDEAVPTPPAATATTPDPATPAATGAEEDAAATAEADAATQTRARPVPCPDEAAVDDVAWTEAEGGASLAVTPSSALRACAGPFLRWESEPPGWDETVALAGPSADSPAMRQQYVCHLRFARAKDVWHLEPWRPLVGEEQLLADRCNPSGP